MHISELSQNPKAISITGFTTVSGARYASIRMDRLMVQIVRYVSARRGGSLGARFLFRLWAISSVCIEFDDYITIVAA